MVSLSTNLCALPPEKARKYYVITHQNISFKMMTHQPKFVLFQNLFKKNHSGVVSDKEEGFLNETMDTFRRDPYEKLKKYIRASGYRLMDLFRDFDKDGSNTISRDEFERGIKVSTVFVMSVYLKIFGGIPM